MQVVDITNKNWNIVLNSYINIKFSSRHVNRTGITVTEIIYDLNYNVTPNKDSIEGVPFAIAYCPLCNTAYAFSRKVNFKDKNYTLKFGTSGMLRMSNLMMWDEQTERWWQHRNLLSIKKSLNKNYLQ